MVMRSSESRESERGLGLSRMPGLVDAADVHGLKAELAAAGEGRMVVLQLGNSEERFEDASSALVFEHRKNLESICKYLALMSGKPVLPIGLVAGQGANTGRALQAYEAALLALELIRNGRFKGYTSHEGSNLHFEEALVRWSTVAPAGASHPTVEGFFASSAHLLGLESVNAFAGSCHLEFLRSVLNPIDVRIGPSLTPADLLCIYMMLNPNKEPGKIVLVTRLGKHASALRGFLRVLREAAAPAVWMCDPLWETMAFGRADSGIPMGDVIAEVEQTARLHAEEGSRLAGLCLEMQREPSSRATRLNFLQTLHVCSDFARVSVAMDEGMG